MGKYLRNSIQFKGYHNPGDYRNASFQYRCFLQTRSYPGSKAIQKEETLSSGLINQKAVNPTAFSCV